MAKSLPLSEIDILQGLNALGIQHGWRDATSYENLAATWGANGLDPLPVDASDIETIAREKLFASYPACPSESALRDAAREAAANDVARLAERRGVATAPQMLAALKQAGMTDDAVAKLAAFAATLPAQP